MEDGLACANYQFVQDRLDFRTTMSLEGAGRSDTWLFLVRLGGNKRCASTGRKAGKATG